jgi:hypothetical protein
MAPGDWQITAQDLDSATIRFQFAPFYGSWEYQAGQLEGIVLHYGGHPELRVEATEDKRVRFDVRHRAAAGPH